MTYIYIHAHAYIAHPCKCVFTYTHTHTLVFISTRRDKNNRLSWSKKSQMRKYKEGHKSVHGGL